MTPNTPMTELPVELEPCPFCGEAPHFNSAEDDQGPYIWVECYCGVDAFYTTVHGGQYRDKELAAAAWNHRPAPSSPPVNKSPNPEHVEGDVLSVEPATHLLDWLEDAYTHCKHGSKEWCEGYLHNARDVIAAAQREIERLRSIVSKDPKTVMIAFEDGDHMRLSRAAGNERKRADTAEAQLADAVKVLEEARDFANSFHITVVDNFYKDVALHLDSPHALSLRLQNDSSKSWIFADLEARRKAVLSTIGEKPDAE